MGKGRELQMKRLLANDEMLMTKNEKNQMRFFSFRQMMRWFP
jgi:hypothetical protein